MDEFSDMPVIDVGEYEHYKGKRYSVLGVGCDTETNEYSVVYQPLYEHAGQPDIWIRPYEMFIETVTVDGVIIPRFRRVDA